MQNKITVLIIEDEKNICDFIATTLRAQGYRTITTGLGREGVSLTAPRIPLYSNFTGLPYEAASLKENLASQVSHPVRWEAAVRHMIAQGADTFLELGPGKTLSGLIGRIDSGVRTFPVETAEELAQAAKEVRAC